MQINTVNQDHTVTTGMDLRVFSEFCMALSKKHKGITMDDPLINNKALVKINKSIAIVNQTSDIQEINLKDKSKIIIIDRGVNLELIDSNNSERFAISVDKFGTVKNVKKFSKLIKDPNKNITPGTTAYILNDWLINGEVGTSSQTIAWKIFGLKKPKSTSHPYDWSDWARCMKLLEKFPEVNNINQMSAISKEWKNIANNYTQLKDFYYSNNKDEFKQLLNDCLSIKSKHKLK